MTSTETAAALAYFDAITPERCPDAFGLSEEEAGEVLAETARYGLRLRAFRATGFGVPGALAFGLPFHLGPPGPARVDSASRPNVGPAASSCAAGPMMRWWSIARHGPRWRWRSAAQASSVKANPLCDHRRKKVFSAAITTQNPGHRAGFRHVWTPLMTTKCRAPRPAQASLNPPDRPGKLVAYLDMALCPGAILNGTLRKAGRTTFVELRRDGPKGRKNAPAGQVLALPVDEIDTAIRILRQAKAKAVEAGSLAS